MQFLNNKMFGNGETLTSIKKKQLSEFVPDEYARKFESSGGNFQELMDNANRILKKLDKEDRAMILVRLQSVPLVTPFPQDFEDLLASMKTGQFKDSKPTKSMLRDAEKIRVLMAQYNVTKRISGSVAVACLETEMQKSFLQNWFLIPRSKRLHYSHAFYMAMEETEALMYVKARFELCMTVVKQVLDSVILSRKDLFNGTKVGTNFLMLSSKEITTLLIQIYGDKYVGVKQQVSEDLLTSSEADTENLGVLVQGSYFVEYHKLIQNKTLRINKGVFSTELRKSVGAIIKSVLALTGVHEYRSGQFKFQKKETKPAWHRHYFDVCKFINRICKDMRAVANKGAKAADRNSEGQGEIKGYDTYFLTESDFE